MQEPVASIEIEIFPASYGDAILVRCVSDLGGANILIDGGTKATYQNFIKNRLYELRSGGGRLDLLVVTHIDTDHIGGVLELLKDNGPAETPKIIEIDDIWHNGYRHLGLEGRAPSPREKDAVLSQVARTGKPMTGEGDISVREADTLAGLIAKHGYAWNRAFGGETALAGSKPTIATDVIFTLLSPTRKELDELAYLWRSELLTMGVSHEAVVCEEFEAAFEVGIQGTEPASSSEDSDISSSDPDDPPDPASFVEDNSATNGSSMAFLLEFSGRRLLFTGDSWPGIILEEWNRHIGGVEGDCLDLIKVSHHGSRRNTSPSLIQRLKARNYVISTDGSRHGHPHLEALLWIVSSARPGANLLFNYPTPSASAINREPLRNRYGYLVSIGSGEESIRVLLRSEDGRDG